MAVVLLTGGAGFLGQHLARELLASGAQVRALSRSEASDAQLRRIGASPVRGDVTDRSTLQAAADGVEAIFHAAADTNTWRPRNATQTRTNVGGVGNLLAAAREAGVGAFMHTSSVSAYSHLVTSTLREDVPERGGESWINYERSKFLAEQAVREAGLPFLIFQPSHILGPGDTRNWSRLIGLVDREKLPGVPPGSGAFADVREIAKAQVRAWQIGRFGETYLLGGQHASFLEFVGITGEMLGRRTPAKATPAWALKGYARLLHTLSLLTGKQPEITPEAAEFTCHHLRVDSSKARAALGYQEPPLRGLLSDTIVWMRSEGMLR